MKYLSDSKKNQIQENRFVSKRPQYLSTQHHDQSHKLKFGSEGKFISTLEEKTGKLMRCDSRSMQIKAMSPSDVGN